MATQCRSGKMRKILVGAWVVAGLAYRGSVLGNAGGAGSPESGWSWQNPLPVGGSLGVAAVDDHTFVAVGLEGTIVRSEDSGLSWSVVPSGTRVNLTAVAFGDTQ